MYDTTPNTEHYITFSSYKAVKLSGKGGMPGIPGRLAL